MVKRRAMVLSICVSVVALLHIAPPGAASSTVTRGALAPELDARDLRTDNSVLLAPLRGRMVLLQFFGTDCPHCQRMAPRMNAIHDGFRARGLAVIGLTPDARPKAERFRHRYRVRHGVALAPMDTLRQYAVTEYPLGILVAPNGRVLWRGRMERLTDRVLEAYLGRVKILPDAPPTLTLVRDALRHRRYGEAERSLDRLRACAGLDAGACRFVVDALDWIAWHQASAFQAAAEDEQRGRWFMAWRAYAELETAYAGGPGGLRAAQAKDRLMQDPDRAGAIRAEQALTGARRLGRWQTRARQIELLRPVADTYQGTAAGREAAALIRLLTQP